MIQLLAEGPIRLITGDEAPPASHWPMVAGVLTGPLLAACVALIVLFIRRIQRNARRSMMNLLHLNARERVLLEQIALTRRVDVASLLLCPSVAQRAIRDHERALAPHARRDSIRSLGSKLTPELADHRQQPGETRRPGR